MMRRRFVKIVLGGMMLMGVMPRSFATQQQRQDVAQQKQEDKELLEKALEYFSSKKYHECLGILETLDKKYRLNPRYKAYLGVCYYYEWDYAHATKCLTEAIPKLEAFSPHERSFYCWANAESLFFQEKYSEAIPYYETMLSMCYDNERPDAEYRLCFCYLFAEDWVNAWNHLLTAQDYYQKFRQTSDMQARIVQIKHMLDGLAPKVVGGVIDELIKRSGNQ